MNIIRSQKQDNTGILPPVPRKEPVYMCVLAGNEASKNQQQKDTSMDNPGGLLSGGPLMV